MSILLTPQGVTGQSRSITLNIDFITIHVIRKTQSDGNLNKDTEEKRPHRDRSQVLSRLHGNTAFGNSRHFVRVNY